MLAAALILLLLGLPLQLVYCARLVITRGHAEPRWYYAAMAGGLCNVASGLLVRDPLLVTGQAALMCIYSLTRPKPAPPEPSSSSTPPQSASQHIRPSSSEDDRDS